MRETGSCENAIEIVVMKDQGRANCRTGWLSSSYNAIGRMVFRFPAAQTATAAVEVHRRRTAGQSAAPRGELASHGVVQSEGRSLGIFFACCWALPGHLSLGGPIIYDSNAFGIKPVFCTRYCMSVIGRRPLP